MWLAASSPSITIRMAAFCKPTSDVGFGAEDASGGDVSGGDAGVDIGQVPFDCCLPYFNIYQPSAAVGLFRVLLGCYSREVIFPSDLESKSRPDGWPPPVQPLFCLPILFSRLPHASLRRSPQEDQWPQARGQKQLRPPQAAAPV